MHFTPQRLGFGGLCALLLAGFLAAPPAADAQTTVRFQDKTAATGLSVKSDPTDVSALEASADDQLDLEIHYSFNSGNTADFFGSLPIVNGLPSWNNDSFLFYGASRPGPGTEAPISLDYDNDGLTDALVNEPAALKLFRGTGSSFVDVTSSASLAAGGEAVAAADYDGDGWTDIATAYGAQVDLWKNLGVNAAGNHLGFANDGLLFTHVASAGAMTWLDIDADGDMDLFIADQSGGPAGFNGSKNTLLINGGAGPSSFALATLPGQLEQANLTTSVAVADVLFDVGSYYPEIVLGGADPELYRNNSGTLQYKSTAGTSSIGGVRVLDFDLDGKLDILHFGGAAAPPVLRHQGASEGFTDAASTVGLTTSGVLAGVTADFDADGDVDVFQADPATSSPKLFLESWDTSQCPNPPCAAGADDPANSWVEVTLQGQPYGAFLTDKTTNTDLIGTRVSMLTGPALWVQGNAGATSAPGVPLVFADVGVQPPTIQVLWPNGHTTTHTVSLNTSYTLEDQSVPYVKDSTVNIQKTLGIGTVSFDFDWDTVGPSTTDKVKITHVSGGGGCYDYAVTLVSSSSQSQLQKGFNAYGHSMSWNDQQCHANCSIDIEVVSENPVAKSWSTKRNLRIKSCIGGL